MWLWLEQFALLLLVAVFPWTRYTGGLNLPPVECVGAMILGLVSLLSCGLVVSIYTSVRLRVAENQATIITLRDKLRRAIAILRWVSIFWLLVGLFILGWGNLVEVDWGLWGYALPVAQILWMLGPLLTWIGLATMNYLLAVKFRQAVLANTGPMQAAAHPMPSLGQYLLWWMRNGLNTLVVFFLIVAVQLEIAIWMQRSGWTRAGLFLYFLLPLVMYAFYGYPWIWMMNTQAIGPRGLKSRLNYLARDAGVRVTQVRAWKTHFMVANAVMVGLARGSRFILISDSLLESLNRDELDAVFAHELGHGRHRHAAWLFGTMFAGSLLGAGLALWWVHHFALGVQWFIPMQVSFFVIFLAAIMPAMHRTFEYQADWFAVLALAQWRGTQRYIDGEFSRDAFACQNDLSISLAVVRSALLRISHLSGHPPDKRSWTHPTTTARIGRIEYLVQHPQAANLLNGQANRLRRVAVGAFIIGLLLLRFR